MLGKMTNYQCNKFLTLLMGDCWHETWDWRPNDFDNPPYVCLECNKRAREVPQNPDHLANPLVVIRWMEKEMPEVWGDYLAETFLPVWHYQEFINKVLDLRNLCAWLVENPAWGEKECDRCMGLGRIKYYMDTCPVCLGTGKIIHPALQWAKERK